MRIILIPVDHTDTVAVGVFVKIGSRYETERNNGISHFLEHMMFKGTKNYSSSVISQSLDGVGAMYNAETSQEQTSYYIYGHKNELDLFIKIIMDIYMHPLFRESDIITERGVVYEELNMYKDDPVDNINDIIHDTLFSNSSLKFSVLGTKKNLSQITRKDLFSFRKKFYVPERTVFVVSGDFDRKKIMPMLENKLSRAVKSSCDITVPIQDPTIQTKMEINVVIKEDIAQTLIVIAFRSHSLYSTYSDVYDLIGDILTSGSSSRLFNLLRNKLGASYFSHSTNMAYSYEGVFTINIGADNKRVDEIIVKILEELYKMVKKGVTKEELEKSKKMRITAFSLGLQTPQDLMNHYGSNEILYRVGGSVPKHIQTKTNVKNRIKAYNSIDIDTINNVISDLFTENKLNIFVYGNKTVNKSKFNGILK